MVDKKGVVKKVKKLKVNKNGLQCKIRPTAWVRHPPCWVQGRDKGRGKPLPWDCRSGRKVGKGGKKASIPPVVQRAGGICDLRS